MKKYIFLILPIFVYASGFSDLINRVDTNLLIKSKDEQTKALQSMLNTKKAKNYPSLDVHLNTTRLQDIPTTMLHLPGFNDPLPMGTRTNISADLSITYPIFTGFAISTDIEKAKLEVIKSSLETTELKRELYLHIVTLYAKIFIVNKTIEATKDAMRAMDDSYKKAKSLYDNGLINISNLYKIEAQKSDIEASLITLREQKENLINTLHYITDIRLDANTLPIVNVSINQNALIRTALTNREDIRIIKTKLKIDDKDISLVNAQKYPQIFLVGAIKKQGDDFNLNGNGYTNANQSYIGAVLSWNIFDGAEKKSEKEAAIYKKNAELLYLSDYERAVKKDLKNAILSLDALNFREKAISKELQASKSYYALTNGRFNNGLASADELSRSIADLAHVKANLQEIKANIFLQKCRISLLCGTRFFTNCLP